jgi:hypothetical protein
VARTRVSNGRSERSQAQRKAKLSTSGLHALLAAGNKAAEHSKHGGRTTKLPPELQAPITMEIEQQLAQLIRQFGIGKVRDALTPLVTNCKFNDWLCVSNAVDRLARKVQHQHEFPPVTRTKKALKSKIASRKGH